MRDAIWNYAPEWLAECCRLESEWANDPNGLVVMGSAYGSCGGSSALADNRGTTGDGEVIATDPALQERIDAYRKALSRATCHET